MEDLTTALLAKQTELGLCPSRFADLLGVSRAYWSLVTREKRQAGPALASAAMRWPELGHVAMLHLAVTVPAQNAAKRGALSRTKRAQHQQRAPQGPQLTIID